MPTIWLMQPKGKNRIRVEVAVCPDCRNSGFAQRRYGSTGKFYIHRCPRCQNPRRNA